MRGQSLIELIVALAIFIIIVSGISYLILNSYFLNQDARERTQAVFIAEEGLEAVRSIRDNNWGALTPGGHGVLLSGGKWIFSGTSDILQNKFTRIVNISDIAAEKKKVTSRVTWHFQKGESRTVELKSYLTNWQMALPGGMLVYGDGGTTSDLIQYKILDPITGTWSAATSTADIDTASANKALRAARAYASPIRNEKILLSRHYVATNQTHYIYGQIFNGTSWGNIILLSSWTGSAKKPFLDVRNFDGTYLQNGDFMAVYSDYTNKPKFQIWNGSSSNWLPQGIVMQDIGQKPTYIIARARPGTNEVMVAVFGQAKYINTQYFNGGPYITSNWTVHSEHSTDAPDDTKKFVDFAWNPNDSLKGALIYSDSGTDTTLNIKTWTANGLGGGSWSSTANTTFQTARLGAMAVSGRFGADEFIACDKDANAIPRIICYKSDSTPSWTNPANQIIASATDTGIQQSFDIGFESSSGTLALGIYSDGTNIPKLKKYNPSTNTWDGSPANINSLSGELETVKLILKEDSDDIMVLLADTNQDFYSIVWDGRADAMYSTPSGKAFSVHGLNGSTDEDFWFDFAWDKF